MKQTQAETERDEVVRIGAWALIVLGVLLLGYYMGRDSVRDQPIQLDPLLSTDFTDTGVGA